MATGDTWKKWERDNTVTINVRLHRVHDADLLEALDSAKANGEAKITALKRWARIGIEADGKK